MKMKNNNIQKDFILGSEWLYYKLYCGEKTADKILLSIIKPITIQLIDNELVLKWFFVRYEDPDSHLRIRFLLKNKKQIGNVILEIHKILKPLLDNNLIWKVQTDTYKRELKRYGKNTIEEIESLFCNDTLMVGHFLKVVESDEQRFVFALRLVENWLDLFQFTTKQGLNFTEQMKFGYAEEFNANKENTKQLNNIYNNVFRAFMDFKAFDERIRNLKFSNKMIIERIVKKHNNNELELSVNDLLASVIHMSINRIFCVRQRQYEFVIYHFLSKFLRTKIEKKNA
ncbi:hypothetical protein MHTCC0001_16620 [Flavobacteriaceae bacterium MHTCC 0001]